MLELVVWTNKDYGKRQIDVGAWSFLLLVAWLPAGHIASAKCLKYEKSTVFYVLIDKRRISGFSRWEPSLTGHILGRDFRCSRTDRVIFCHWQSLLMQTEQFISYGIEKLRGHIDQNPLPKTLRQHQSKFLSEGLLRQGDEVKTRIPRELAGILYPTGQRYGVLEVDGVEPTNNREE